MKICGVVQSKNTKQTINDINLISGVVDLIEVRLDYREEPLNLIRILETCDIPLIATNRKDEQGGYSQEPHPERMEILLKASEKGFQYIDLELDTPGLTSIIKIIQRNGSLVIGSHHDYEATPTIEEMESLLQEGKKVGADLVKLIGTATKREDNLVYLNFTLRHPGNISFGMGEEGVLSRVFSPLMGGAFTYASVQKEKKSAPGQLTVHVVKEIYRLLGICL